MNSLIEQIMHCPQTGNKLHVEKDRVSVQNSPVTYPVYNGIIDFIPAVRNEITGSYDQAPSQGYDEMILASKWYMKLFVRLVWGFSRPMEYIEKLHSFLPDDFEGVLLDVPVGTGALTVAKYKRMKKATIIACDYSMGMIQRAKQRFEQAGINDVVYIRGDIGNLPIMDSCIDFLVTMNGFHAFSDKEKALEEMKRITRPGKNTAGCFYICRQRWMTDFVVNNIYTKMGVFTPPYYGKEEVINRLEADYALSEKNNLKGIFYFNGIRK